MRVEMRRALVGPNLSAKNPRKMAKIPKASLPAKEVIDPSVARCSLVNSVCMILLLATSVTPKSNEEVDIKIGEKTLAMMREIILVVLP